MKLALGAKFTHASWWSGLDRAKCEVVAVREDAYKGQPVTLVVVQEVGGARRATYQQGRVPVRVGK